MGYWEGDTYIPSDYEKAQSSGLQSDVNSLGVNIYGTPEQQQGEVQARKNASIYYGSSQDLGQNAADYRARLKAKVDQPSALANQMTQSANQQIARSNARAGLSGVDTSARNIAEQRNSQMKADEAQQASNAVNLANYGKSIGAGISGTEALAAAGAGRGTAATPTPTPSYGGGIFGGSIICTELYRQKKITGWEMIGCRNFGSKIPHETFRGYLIIATPIVALMKKSDKFSNLFIGWAKSISRGEKNRFTRFMIPICTVIGKIKLEYKYVKRA